jgi:hypothetical protein
MKSRLFAVTFSPSDPAIIRLEAPCKVVQESPRPIFGFSAVVFSEQTKICQEFTACLSRSFAAPCPRLRAQIGIEAVAAGDGTLQTCNMLFFQTN